MSPLRQPLLLPNYRRFQLMRFTVAEINNSTHLLPNVSLGYEIFDYCADIVGFPSVWRLFSAVETCHNKSEHIQSKGIAVVGPFTSTQVITAAPLFMEDLISMVSLPLIMFLTVLWVEMNACAYDCVGRSAMEPRALCCPRSRSIPPF